MPPPLARPAVSQKRAPQRARRRAPSEKRAQIASAAADLFAECGYAGATTARIAERAGVSEGIVFHHFRTKRDLFRGVVADYGVEFVKAMFGDDPAASPPTPRSAIEAGFAFVRDHADLHRAFATRDPDLSAIVVAGTHDPIVAALEKTLETAVARGHARAMNTRIVSELCYSLVDGALQACFTFGDGSGEAEYLAETIHCVESACIPDVPSAEPSKRSS